MKSSTRSCLLSIILFGLPFNSWAQYAINGKVVDDVTGEALLGATVVIQGNKGMITDLDGRFAIRGIKKSDIQLDVSYVGYEPKSVDIKLSEKVTKLAVRMRESSTALDEVVVNGIAEGQIAAMINMKKAETIKNVVSSEQIVTFPDLNAAEVMQRIPGITLQRDQGEGRFVQLRGTPPELTNFNINGEQIPSPEGDFRYVGLDIIPSDQIEFIEVTKVMTPDMDGDGIGGSVNVITKEAKEGPPQIRAVLASGYNNLRETPIYNLQFAYGERFNKFGFQINGSFFENNQGSDNIEYKYVKGPFFGDDSQQQGKENFNLHYREVQLRHYDITRTRIAVSPSLDYKFNDHSKIFLKGMYNSFVDEETRRRKIFDLEDPLSATAFLFGGIDHDVRFRTQKQQLSTLAFGGEHAIGKINLDYQLFVAEASETTPDYFEARFESPGQAIRIDFDLSDPEYPRATFPNPSSADNATDFENFELDEMQLEDSNVEEFLFTPRINIQIPYALSNKQDGYLKFGGKIRSRTKEQKVENTTLGAYFETSNIYPGEGEPLNLAIASDDFREDNLLNQGYVLEYMPSKDILLDHYEFNKQFYIFNRNEFRKNSFNQDYKYEEDIYAAYGMFRHNINRLMILGGLRFERTDVTENTGFGVILDGNRFVGIDTIRNSKIQDFWLPQIQLKYAVNSEINARASITRTYARPNYVDVIPSREEDRNEVEIGNPDINFPTSTNIDLMVERYHKGSILSAGFFYKKIEDFIYNFKRFGREGEPGSGNFPVFEFTKPLNGKDADIFGAELQLQSKFNFLPGILSDFGLYTNYTYTYSQAFLPQRVSANFAEAIIIDVLEDDLSEFFTQDEQEEIPLPGQAEHTANFALFYDGPRFFARLTANFQDDFLVEIGPDADLDEYYDDALRLDYTMNYTLNDNITLFGDWINITNTPLRFYLGEEDVIKQQEFYSWWFRLGARINL